MITIGVDFHKKTSSYHVLDSGGRVIKKIKMINDTEKIQQFINSFDSPKRLAMEATRSWPLFHDSVKNLIDEFQLGHPKKMKMITESSIKTDKHDAKAIAELAHLGYLPQAYVSSPAEQNLRNLVRFRGQVIKQRRAIKQHVHALIDRNVWPSEKPKSFKNIFCARGRTWLENLSLPENERLILNQSLEELDYFNTIINTIEKRLTEEKVQLPLMKYLCTTPGFRTQGINAYSVLIETGNIDRFQKANGFIHYAGLVPRQHSSGDKLRSGRLVKDANIHLRTALIESTLAAIRTDKGLKIYYKKVRANSGSGPAIIATARKLAKAIFYVLKEKRNYIHEEIINPPAVACHPSAVSLKR